jgi:hypothetical protein
VKLLKIGVVALGVLAAFAIFIVFGRPPDEMAQLKPLIKSEKVDYYRAVDPMTGKVTCSRLRTIDTNCIDEGEANRAISKIHPPYAWVGTASDGRVLYPEISVMSSVDLSWSQIAWVRATHLGRNPFQEQPSIEPSDILFIGGGGRVMAEPLTPSQNRDPTLNMR